MRLLLRKLDLRRRLVDDNQRIIRRDALKALAEKFYSTFLKYALSARELRLASERFSYGHTVGPEEDSMNIKMLSMAAITLAMMGGVALAGSSTGTSALDDPAKMSPFFTDAGMKTMRAEKDFKTAWMAMKPSEKTAMLKDCGDATINKSHADFCAMAKKMGN